MQKAYLLYDNGYDVWMGNCRGTRPSQGHLHFSPTGAQSKEYWSFSLHQIGIYDLPASIDYILEKTNQTQLHYVGFSQGTTLFFIMTSVLPDYNEKITSMIAMAPIVIMKHSQHTFLNILSKYYALIKKVLDFYKIYSIDYGNKALRWLAEYACKKIENKSPFPCQFLLFFLDSNQINCVRSKWNFTLTFWSCNVLKTTSVSIFFFFTFIFIADKFTENRSFNSE